jgi:hypothetical protein
MNMPIAEGTLRRRRIFSWYFLVIAIPGGLLALWGDLMFGSAVWEEIAHWNRRPHSLWFFETFGFVILYLVLINLGFLLLRGYVRSLQPPRKISRNAGNEFWIISLTYNIIIGGVNGWYVHAQAPGTFFNPLGIPFWMVGVPFVGTVLSALCLTRYTNDRTTLPTPLLIP